MIFYVLRHGETFKNLEKIIQGSSLNSNLTVTGINQIKMISEYFYNIKIDLICSSHLIRAIETASIIASLNDYNHNLYIIPEFCERNYGYLDGTDYLKFREVENKKSFEVESDEALKKRVLYGIEIIKKIKLKDNANIVISTHSQIYKTFALLCNSKEHNYYTPIKNGQCIIIEFTKDNKGNNFKLLKEIYV